MSESKVDVVATVKGNAAEEWNRIATAAGGVEKATKDAETATKSWEAAGTKAATAATKSWENTKKSVADAANTVANAGKIALATAAALTAAVVQGAVANERHERALRALGPAYAEVQRATQGTVTATEAWHTQQALLQTGLPTTGRELALITRAARDYAVATGTETPAAIEQLTQALANGEAGGLRRFGIAVQAGATRTQTFNSALQQLQRTQASSAPASRTLAEEVSHFGSTLTEAGSALAGFYAQAVDLQTTMRLVGDSVRDAAGELRYLIELNNHAPANTGAVRGMIRGAGGPRRPVDPRLAEGQRIGEASTALALRAAQEATERANAPVSGGGGGGPAWTPSREERRWAEEQQVEIRRRAALLALEAPVKTRIAAETALAQMLAEITTAENLATDATKTRRRALEDLGDAEKTAADAMREALYHRVDTERQARAELIGIVHDHRDAEISLARAAGNEADANRRQVLDLTMLRTAQRSMLAEVNARIEAAQREHRSAAEINALYRERVGLINGVADSTRKLAEIQRENTRGVTEFTSAMGGAGLSAVSAFTDGIWAAVEANENVGLAFAAALREQLKSLAKESVPQVFKNLALAASSAFTNPAAVPSFLTAAGLWTAVGAVSGGIAAGIPAPAKAPTAAGSGDRAASANAARAPSDSSGGGVTLNITVSGVATTHEGVQDAIVRSLDAAHARGVFLRQMRRD